MRRVTAEDLAEVVRFFRDLAVAETPDNPAAGEGGEAGLRRSLAAWDFLSGEACFLLLAHLAGEPAGYLLAVRIPKADARVGFLYVDELYVLPTFRRRGVARALLERVQALTVELGLAGVRLLVRPENEAARRLYRQCGFEEHETVFCEWQVQERQGTEGERDKKQGARNGAATWQVQKGQERGGERKVQGARDGTAT